MKLLRRFPTMKLLRMFPTVFICTMWNLVSGTPMPRSVGGTVWFVSMPPILLQTDRLVTGGLFEFTFGRTGSTPYCSVGERSTA